MPGQATYCYIHSPHTDPGVKVGNMTTKPTPGPRTIGKKNVCMCPRPGRLDGEAGPSGSNGDGDDQGDDHQRNDNGNDNSGVAGDRKVVWARPMPRMINSSGFYDPKPDPKPRKPKNVVPAGKKPRLTHMRHAPPPPRPSRDDNASVEGRPSADQSDNTQSMSTFQRMLTPPVSDADSPPPKKQPSEDVRVFMSKGFGKAVPHKDRPYHCPHIKNQPFKVQPPNPDKERKGSYNSTKNATKQKSFRDNSLPCAVEKGPENDADNQSEDRPAKASTCTSPMLEASEKDVFEEHHLCSDKPKKGIESPGNTLTALTPPPSADESDWHDVQDDSFQDNDSTVNEGDSLLRRMISAPASDDNSPSKKQPSEDFRVFLNSGNSKTKPNKDYHLLRNTDRNMPYQPKRPDPAKEVKNPHISATEKQKQNKKRKQAKKAKACCDQGARPRKGPDNDADKEDNGINSPVSSGTSSSPSSTLKAFFTPPSTPKRPVTRSRSKQLADEAAQEQTTDDHYQASPSTSPPPVKRKRNHGCSPQPDTPVSPLSLSQRPLKRPGGSPGSSPLVSPSPRPTKRTRCQ
jgi:hypothetical protein